MKRILFEETGGYHDNIRAMLATLKKAAIQAINFFRCHFSRSAWLLLICCGMLFTAAIAQDPIFTQAFLSPVYLNPAATGTGDYDLRVSGIYRRQWWTVPSNMNAMVVSVDKFVPDISGGIGLTAVHSSEGYLNKNGIYASYAYNICSGTASVADNGGSPKWFWTGGLQFGFAQSKIDFNKLVFADQINTGGYIPGSVSSANPPLRSGRVFPDFAAGTFFNYNINDYNRLLLGFSGHHINKPDESLTYSSDTVRSQLPVRWSGNVLYTHTDPSQTWSYSLAAIGYRQAFNSSYQVGTEITQNQFDISLGIWYRFSTKDKTFNFPPVNTFSVSLAINLTGNSGNKDKVRVGVAHDAEVGKKSYSYTTGSSEIGFVWDHSTYNMGVDDPCKPKISSTVCPAFVK